jgi:hypothetical protein
MYSIILALIVVLLGGVALFAVGTPDKSGKKEQIYQQLSECQELISGGASERKDCLIRLDVLLGKSMEFAGVKGSTVGEKLKNAGELFDRDLYEQLWQGHKLRNRVVHENAPVSGSELKTTVKYFRRAIKRLVK